MRTILLGLAAPLAAIALPAAPAAAHEPAGFTATPGPVPEVLIATGERRVVRHGHRDGDGDRGRGRHRRFDPVVLGHWAWSNDFDGNRSFDADRWNDWWHERPHRSYPRWVRHNDGCERMYWSGGGWRC
jgi:hypothetical protein